VRARRSEPERGQSTVELALVLPVVALLLLALLQVGLVARDVVLVSHAAREGARAAATDSDPAAAERAAARSGGLDPTRMDVTVRGREGPGSRVRVTVDYAIPTSVPIVGSLLGEISVATSVTMRVEGG
jgi:Flp pilus assembly protein TadG